MDSLTVRATPTTEQQVMKIDHARLLIQNYSNFKRSSDPTRIMFFDDGSWIDYPAEVLAALKLGFGNGLPVVEAEFEGRALLFDFHRMLEIELVSGNQRSIAWIDVDGKCFFPKVFVSTYGEKDAEFVDNDENLPKIKIEIKIGEEDYASSESSERLRVRKTVNLMSKRKREDNVDKENAEGGSCSNQNERKRRQMCASESQSARWPKTKVFGATDKGYAVVMNLFQSGLGRVDPGAKVTALHQCVRAGPLDKARHLVFAKQVENTKRVRGESNVVFAWFGTSAKGVESILSHGFGMPGQVSNREGRGVGIYLSPIRSPDNSAMLSETDENGERHVIMCRVIVGKSEKIEAGSEQSHPSSVEYDTGVDDLEKPNWYIVWQANMNTHILPECIVSYRPGNVSGFVNGVPKMNSAPNSPFVIPKLIEKLKSSLPRPKIQELGNLCGLFKEGKLGKDGFLKQLRSVVGDDVLRSAIQEIRG